MQSSGHDVSSAFLQVPARSKCPWWAHQNHGLSTNPNLPPSSGCCRWLHAGCMLAAGTMVFPRIFESFDNPGGTTRFNHCFDMS